MKEDINQKKKKDEQDEVTQIILDLNDVKKIHYNFLNSKIQITQYGSFAFTETYIISKKNPCSTKEFKFEYSTKDKEEDVSLIKSKLAVEGQTELGWNRLIKKQLIKFNLLKLIKFRNEKELKNLKKFEEQGYF